VNQKMAHKKLRHRQYLGEGTTPWIWAFSKRPDVEFAIQIVSADSFQVQIGMGGEWWNGRLRLGRNILYHRKGKVDPAYRPVTAEVSHRKDGIYFSISGGFYGDQTAKFTMRLVANT